MALNTTPLYRLKLDSTFDGHAVTHRTFQSDLPLRRPAGLTTVWHSQRELGTGGLGVVWLQKQEGTADVRAVKIISKAHLQPQEMGALVEIRDVCSTSPCSGYSHSSRMRSAQISSSGVWAGSKIPIPSTLRWSMCSTVI